jgi:hypothetical protein
MYMSINHGEIIDDFKKCGSVVVRESFDKHKPSDAWTNCDQSHSGQTGSLIVAPGLGKLIFALRV